MALAELHAMYTVVIYSNSSRVGRCVCVASNVWCRLVCLFYFFPSFFCHLIRTRQHTSSICKRSQLSVSYLLYISLSLGFLVVWIDGCQFPLPGLRLRNSSRFVPDGRRPLTHAGTGAIKIRSSRGNCDDARLQGYILPNAWLFLVQHPGREEIN